MTPKWLFNVQLHEFTAAIRRDREHSAPSDLCGAQPARAFADQWCRRQADHDGDHSGIEATASRMDSMQALKDKAGK